MIDFNFKLDIVKILKDVKAGDRVVVGYASTFDVDSDDMQITCEALEGAREDLLTYSTVLFNHDMDRPIGKVVDTEVDEIGLLVKVILSSEEDDIWKKVQEGVINKFSIKGRALEMRAVEGKDLIQQITKIKLFEVSLVSVPANKEAKTISHWIAKSLKKNEEQEDKDETSSNTNETKNMNELLEKLKVILEKEKSDDIKAGLTELVKALETEDDILAKLEVVAGKLSGEDKDVVDFAIGLLKTKTKTVANDQEEAHLEDSFDLDDESDKRPVFQLNGSITEVELDDDNKFRKQLLKFGKWFHWDADGGVLNISEEVIDNIVKNFKKGTIDHVYVPLSHTNDPTKNAGEVVKLEKTESGLDAVIEIKDETVLEKIKKGLIKCVSASLDPNYRVKSSNKFVGPTLLHAALVSEPFIKGMSNFVSLSDDFEGRSVIQLEDQEPNFFEIMKALKDSFENIEDKIVSKEEIAEVFAEIYKGSDINEEIKKDGEEEEKEEEKTEEAAEEKTDEEAVEEKTDETTEDKEDEKKEETEEEKVEEVEKKLHKPGEACMADGKKGHYVKEGDKLVCKALTEKELEELTKTKFQSCMSREMKAGKTMAEAAKICKTDTKKSIEKMYSEATSVEKTEDKSEDTAPHVDFADAERVFEDYLKRGKVVPAQKEAFIKLIASGKELKLGDDTVGVSELIKTFMESQPSSIDFDEDGVPVDDEEKKDKENGGEEERSDLSDVPAEARELFGKMGLSNEDIKTSWDTAKITKEQEDEDKSSLFN